MCEGGKDVFKKEGRNVLEKEKKGKEEMKEKMK